MKRAVAAILAIAIGVLSTSCVAEKKRYEAEFLTLFDTVTKIVAYTNSKEEFTKYSQFIHDELETYHELYDIYNDYTGVNNIKTINDNAGKLPVKVDNRIIDLLLLSKEMHEKTGGRVNIALGSVLTLWHDYRTAGINDPANAELPPTKKLEEANEHTDINSIVIDKEASTVFISDPMTSIDVGSIGKGYAVEQVCLSAKKEGLNSALVSVGGNVRAIGSKDGKSEPWKVGIQNPNEDGLLQTVKVSNKSLVTSGDYQRYYIVDEKIYHHIIDPSTLMPAAYVTAVSIICTDSGVADAMSTAVFNMDYESGRSFVDKLDGVEALWVMLDGSVIATDGFGK